MDSELLGQLVDQHARNLELYARQWTSATDDVVQEAFVALASQRAQPTDPVAWLYRAVRNAAINAAQAARRRRRHEHNATARTLWFTHHPSQAIDAEEAESALRGLSETQREVIVAHLWGGLRFDQIAELTGLSSSTAHRQYQAGLSILRERLGVSCTKPTTRSTRS